jgi:hypothetical protein
MLRIYRDRSKGYCPNMIETIAGALNAGADHIIVLVSGPLDKEGTDQAIDKVFTTEQVSVLRLESYRNADYWSVALNEGIQFLATRFEISSEDKLLVFSNEVSLTSEILRKMNEAMVAGVGVVGVTFPGFSAPSYRFPRNTLALWRLETLIRFGGFCAECDVRGGMEDYYLVRVLESKGFRYVMIDSSDVVLKIASSTNQEAKEKRELSAMEASDQLLKKRFNI